MSISRRIFSLQKTSRGFAGSAVFRLKEGTSRFSARMRASVSALGHQLSSLLFDPLERYRYFLDVAVEHL